MPEGERDGSSDERNDDGSGGKSAAPDRTIDVKSFEKIFYTGEKV